MAAVASSPTARRTRAANADTTEPGPHATSSDTSLARGPAARPAGRARLVVQRRRGREQRRLAGELVGDGLRRAAAAAWKVAVMGDLREEGATLPVVPGEGDVAPWPRARRAEVGMPGSKRLRASTALPREALRQRSREDVLRRHRGMPASGRGSAAALTHSPARAAARAWRTAC